jgi:NADH-quinone oxidoreductase subunit J
VFLVVYVGAVAVLFLFVLMMLNIKLAELTDNHFYVLPVGLLIGFVTIYQLAFLLRFEFDFFERLDVISSLFLSEFSNVTTLKMDFFNVNTALSNIRLLGFTLFSKYLYHFIIAGFVLLLAMISAILLTLQKNFINKTQNIYGQILKDYNTALKLVA